MNPYDPEWELYLEERLGVKMVGNLQGKRTLRYLWLEQNGLCPICNEKITQLTGWHNHPLVWRVMGGTDGVEKGVLLHPYCHAQVHAQGFSVSKPRSARSVGQA